MGFFCVSICGDAYTGLTCEKNKTVCEPNPCLNSGVCYEPSAGKWACKCPTGTFGDNCASILNGKLIKKKIIFQIIFFIIEFFV